MSDLRWLDEALCAQTDPEAHFPRVGHGIDDAAAAKRTCRACAVRVECLEWALDNEETEGVWGGMSARERRGLNKKRRRSA